VLLHHGAATIGRSRSPSYVKLPQKTWNPRSQLPTIFAPNYFAKERQQPSFFTFPDLFENQSRAAQHSARFL
jgi:hypothetical protein